MPIEILKEKDRGTTRLSWLEGKHTFSFGEFFDPLRKRFSDLRVINEDRVSPGTGFDTHPHQNMEIFTYILSGELTHQDSMGNGSVIRPGDIQLMSAGRGVTHNEVNASNTVPVHLLQIWIYPNTQDTEPTYQQIQVSLQEKTSRLKLVISPDREPGTLFIQQDARVYSSYLNRGHILSETTSPERKYFIHVATGKIRVNGQSASAGDGLQITEMSSLQITCDQDSEFLLFDLRK